jgi:cytochrome P450
LKASASPPGPSFQESQALLREMKKDPILALTKLYRTYGEVSHFRALENEVYFMNSPDFVKQVSVVNHHDFVKNQGSGIENSSGIYESLGVKGNRIFEELVGDGILMSEDGLHDWHRRVMQPAFNRDSIATYAQSMTDLIAKWCDRRADGETISVRKEMQGLTLRIVLKSLFSVEGAEADEFAADLAEFGRTGEASHQSAEPGASDPVLGLRGVLPFSDKKKYEKAVEKLDRFVYRMIDRRRQGGGRTDLMSYLLRKQAPGETEKALADKEIRDEVLTIVLAGHETVTNALTWTWYLLSTHPGVDAKLRSELGVVLGGRVPSFQDVSRLTYTSMVFNEALRLYPPVWLERRRAIRDISFGGYTIPFGSVVLISQYVMHHDPAYYANPEEFDPERWSAERRGGIPTFAFFPFGVGPRACIGEPFARLEAPLVISMVAQRWRMEFVSEKKPEVEPHVTLQPSTPILMRMRPS